MNVEDQHREIGRRKKEKRLKKQQAIKALFRWKKHDKDDCVCHNDTAELLERYPVSVLRRQDDFDIETDAESLWACKQCGRVPSETEVDQLGLSNQQ